MQLDQIDVKIIKLLAEDPNLSHSEIARRVCRSQPAVGSRIKKLRRKGLLHKTFGADFQKIDMVLVKVDFNCSTPEDVIRMVSKCPQVVSALRLSGERNFSLLITGDSLRHVDEIIDKHLRSREDVQDLSMEVITGALTSLVLPVRVEAITN
ncbi:MAG: winged helix-turn-helix transcriptional regulator [Promethearchaeota archaeon]